MTDTDLLTLDAAAKFIPNADADTLKRMARAGKLTVYRPGKSFLTTRADVMKAVEQCRIDGNRSLPDEGSKLDQVTVEVQREWPARMPAFSLDDFGKSEL